MFYKKNIIALLITAIFPFSIAIADDAALMKEKCGICHGDDGNSNDEKVPSIASFTASALEDMLEEYKEGDRKAEKFKPKDGEESSMDEVAKNLSSDDAEKIFLYIATLKFHPVKQDFDAKLAKKGKKLHKKKCEKCHSEQGSSVEDDTPVLAGQWKAYLQSEFASLATGERDMPKKMKRRFKKLSADDRKALIEFYISQQ